MSTPKIIDEIIEEFEKEFIYHFPGDYNWGDPREPYDELTKQNPVEYINFLSSSLQKAIQSERERCIGCVPEENDDYCGDSWEEGYKVGFDACGKKTIDAINKG